MEWNEVISAVVGPNDQGRYKNTIGFFVEEWFEDGTEKLLDEYYVQKPIVQISEFSDDNHEYYCFDFIYGSKRDEDLRRQWDFLKKFVARSLKNIDKTESATVLHVSFIPTSLKGKYSLFAKLGIPNTIVYTESALDGSCTIKIIFLKEDVIVLSHDEDLVDMHQIEREAELELEEEEEDESKVVAPTKNN